MFKEKENLEIEKKILTFYEVCDPKIAVKIIGIF